MKTITADIARHINRIDAADNWDVNNVEYDLHKIMDYTGIYLTRTDDGKCIECYDGRVYPFEDLDQVYDLCCEELDQDELAKIRATSTYSMVIVELMDPDTGACSPIDKIIADESYTPEQYLKDCEGNVDWGVGPEYISFTEMD